jgi:tetratricopeptide (TPR) repeat protein
MSPKCKWAFQPRFRRHAFGWRSQQPIKRIAEAVAEIKKVALKDPTLAAEGAVLFLERVSPALDRVDSSSGAIGTAVNHAIDALAAVIAQAPADEKLRDRWLERLWRAVEEDRIPYIEILPEYWGDLCVTPERASGWADDFIGIVRMAWSPNPELRGYFKGTPACLSALFKARRYAEIIELLELAPHKFWCERKWGVKALMAMGRQAEALRFAETTRGLNESPAEIAQACEEILLASGMAEEAYNRYAIEANRSTTYLATFRSIVKKYPHKKPAEVLNDLVASTPGDEGKWFAAAKSAGLYDEAIELVHRTPCDPRTLIRAARDLASKEPRFAMEAGLAALRWLVAGYGYEIAALEVRDAYANALKAAEIAGCADEAFEKIRQLVAGEDVGNRFVRQILGRELGLD